MFIEFKNVLFVFFLFKFVEEFFVNKRFVVYCVVAITINKFKLEILFVVFNIVIIKILNIYILNNFNAFVVIFSIIKYICYFLYSSFYAKQHQFLKV